MIGLSIQSKLFRPIAYQVLWQNLKKKISCLQQSVLITVTDYSLNSKIKLILQGFYPITILLLITKTVSKLFNPLNRIPQHHHPRIIHPSDTHSELWSDVNKYQTQHIRCTSEITVKGLTILPLLHVLSLQFDICRADLVAEIRRRTSEA